MPTVAKRVAVAAFYLDEINAREADDLDTAGFENTDIQCLPLEKDSDIVRLRPHFITDVARSVTSEDAGTVFISCGALSTIDFLDDLEQRLGKPFICSHQTMLWDVLRRAGVTDAL